MKKGIRKKLLALAIVIILVAVVLTGLSQFYTEYLWFDHLGFSSVYLKRFLSQVGIGVVFGIIAFLVLGIHILFIRKFSRPRPDWTIPTSTGEIIDIKDVVKKISTPLVIIVGLIVAAIMGYWAGRHWEEVLRYWNQTAFNQRDPILNKDIGFYLFSLPLFEFVQQWCVYLLAACAALAGTVYLLRNAIELKGRELVMPDNVRAHLLVALACLLFLIAWGWRLEMFEILFSKRGVAYGATYTDVYVNLIVYRIMIAACIVCGLFLVGIAFVRLNSKKATLYPLFALGGVLVLCLFGSFVCPSIVQNFIVTPNELDKERPFLAHAISGTRHAYQLDKIESHAFPSLDNLTLADLAENKPTIDNIKIWDHRPLRATYKQVQEIRLYYEFPSITVDRYRADGKYWQVMLSPRELVIDQLSDQSQTWVNRHLQYTHGYGACLSPVKDVIGEGLPDLWIKDIPPVSRYPHMKITRPEIYYGLQTTDYALVKTNIEEFDYPKGQENEYTTYQGKGGVSIGSFLNRLLFTIRFADINLLFTQYLKLESRILFNRTIPDRIAAITPFLMLDQEPYMVVLNGRLLWVQDAYTINYRYPYSQPTSLGRRARINYIRNSVKVVVDAFDGTVTYYMWDTQEPMIQTYAKIFPTLFKSATDMPQGLREHIRYPKDLFTIQAVMYETFHMTDPQIFYNQEDKWTVSGELGEKSIDRQIEQTDTAFTPGVTAKKVTSTNRMEPYYMIMRLPKEKKEEYLLIAPFSPANKDNMVAWITARCDGDHYGKLLVYTFPKQRLVYGPMQIEARIDQDEYISQWITLRNQKGSTVIRGDLLVIPINESILYVEPIYLQSKQTQLPELKQIVVAFGKKISMKDTLKEALEDVFDIADNGLIHDLRSEQPTAAQKAIKKIYTEKIQSKDNQSSGTETARDLLQQSLDHFKNAQQKLSTNDWAGYGREQDALKKALESLTEVLQGKLKKPILKNKKQNNE